MAAVVVPEQPVPVGETHPISLLTIDMTDRPDGDIA